MHDVIILLLLLIVTLMLVKPTVLENFTNAYQMDEVAS